MMNSSEEASREGSTSKPTTIPLPREFMRNRRPELFADTAVRSRPVLHRDLLELRLDQLTTRDEHFHFEALCTRLVRKVLCANIKPTTGPSPGGDGGTDGTTFPVSEELALRSYTGPAAVAGVDQQWAFAFSCKQNWKSKISSDIAKISKLPIEYTRAVFISSRPIRKKDREKCEREFSERYGFDVQVLDRAWIVSQVIDGGYADLAIETLGMDSSIGEKPVLSPRDYDKTQALEKLEQDFRNIDLYYGNDVALIQDYLRAAELSRGLDHPREETEIFYRKAIEIASHEAHRGLELRARYLLGWTTYWWYNDPGTLSSLYGEMEQLLDSSSSADDCERFVILLKLLRTAVAMGHISSEVADYDHRRRRLEKIIKLNHADKSRPNNALLAEMLLLILSLNDTLWNHQDPQPLFDQLAQCLKRSSGLSTFPAMKFVEMLIESGDVFGDIPGYDELFEVLEQIARARGGEVKHGELLFQRGLQKAEAGRFAEALSLVGKSRLLLMKQESYANGLHATLAACDLYREMELPWASRSEALLAAHMATRKEGGAFVVPWEGLLAVKRLMWIELTLGRLPAALGWRLIATGLVNYLLGEKYELDKVTDEINSFDGVLGCFIMGLNDESFKVISNWSKKLDSEGLIVSSGAILYRNDEIGAILEQAGSVFNNDEKEVVEMFEASKSQPASEYLPRQLDQVSPEYSEYSSTNFGVTFRIRTRNRFGCQVFSENLLSVIEAVLALARWEELAFICDRMDIVVDVSSQGQCPPGFAYKDIVNSDRLELYFGEDIEEWLYVGERKSMQEFFYQIVINLLLYTTIDTLEELKDTIERWFKEDTFNRALATSPTSVAITDILGTGAYDYTK